MKARSDLDPYGPPALEEILARSEGIMEVADDRGPVRTIFNGRRNRPVGLYPSVKCRRSIAWESRLERRTIRWLEVDDTVINYMEQPHRLRFLFRGQRTHYTPDFIVQTENRTVFVEVKYRSDIFKMRPEDRDRYRLARSIYRSIDRDLVFVTDLRFKMQKVWHENAQVVEESRRLLPSDDQLTIIIDHLVSRPRSTLGACAAAFGSPLHGQRSLMALMLRRVVRIDLNIPLGPDSAIELRKDYAANLHNLVAAKTVRHA
ncbi:TnsA endonuclease N-terminal domain-containing protein [Chenggangzhangella methanolivorans]|uniref:TnsA endonuclease N-terminal domain-containing protein n=1 Tax=Chenggangzhangella methanolivorans TaxID=1437009 RepID=A0A9E6RD19_9HYPH|nr:TnsA endonuclease N-terminal domain-containing protein [Chenggangzhangella methanolivorans]QZO02067.1 TnsA endonuclease N-terminal domain-containing protein [Chenggangzhangella methanolivorans]